MRFVAYSEAQFSKRFVVQADAWETRARIGLRALYSVACFNLEFRSSSSATSTRPLLSALQVAARANNIETRISMSAFLATRPFHTLSTTFPTIFPQWYLKTKQTVKPHPTQGERGQSQPIHNAFRHGGLPAEAAVASLARGSVPVRVPNFQGFLTSPEGGQHSAPFFTRKALCGTLSAPTS